MGGGGRQGVDLVHPPPNVLILLFSLGLLSFLSNFNIMSRFSPFLVISTALAFVSVEANHYARQNELRHTTHTYRVRSLKGGFVGRWRFQCRSFICSFQREDGQYLVANAETGAMEFSYVEAPDNLGKFRIYEHAYKWLIEAPKVKRKNGEKLGCRSRTPRTYNNCNWDPSHYTEKMLDCSDVQKCEFNKDWDARHKNGGVTEFYFFRVKDLNVGDVIQCQNDNKFYVHAGLKRYPLQEHSTDAVNRWSTGTLTNSIVKTVDDCGHIPVKMPFTKNPLSQEDWHKKNLLSVVQQGLSDGDVIHCKDDEVNRYVHAKSNLYKFEVNPETGVSRNAVKIWSMGEPSGENGIWNSKVQMNVNCADLIIQTPITGNDLSFDDYLTKDIRDAVLNGKVHTITALPASTSVAPMPPKKAPTSPDAYSPQIKPTSPKTVRRCRLK